MRRATSSFGTITAAALLAITAAPAQAFDLEGHRGTRGLMPENTLAAFSRALAIGVTTLETDIAVTRDGVLVISHDPFLNPDVVRGTDGHWLAAKGPPIHSLTLAELQRYDVGRLNPESKYAQQFPQQTAVDGQRFPTLAEVFALARAAPKPVRLNLETKITPVSADETVDAATFAKLLVGAIRGAQMTSRTTIQSFDWRTLVESRKQAPEIETACLTIETPNFDTVQSKSDKPSPWLAGLDLAKATIAAAPREGRRLRDLVAVLAQRDAGAGRGGTRTGTQGAAVDRQRSRRHRRADRRRRRRHHHRLSGPRPHGDERKGHSAAVTPRGRAYRWRVHRFHGPDTRRELGLG